jgi:acyl-CoA synthetase (NDP forming)
MKELKTLFEPRNVALIGSGKIREKVGMTSPELFENVVYNMKKFFQGQTILVDIEKEEARILLKAPDLGVIMLPPKLAVQEAERCAKIGVKA